MLLRETPTEHRETPRSTWLPFDPPRQIRVSVATAIKLAGTQSVAARVDAISARYYVIMVDRTRSTKGSDNGTEAADRAGTPASPQAAKRMSHAS
jgi:hypothetical protein